MKNRSSRLYSFFILSLLFLTNLAFIWSPSNQCIDDITPYFSIDFDQFSIKVDVSDEHDSTVTITGNISLDYMGNESNKEFYVDLQVYSDGFEYQISKEKFFIQNNTKTPFKIFIFIPAGTPLKNGSIYESYFVRVNGTWMTANGLYNGFVSMKNCRIDIKKKYGFYVDKDEVKIIVKNNTKIFYDFNITNNSNTFMLLRINVEYLYPQPKNYYYHIERDKFSIKYNETKMINCSFSGDFTSKDNGDYIIILNITSPNFYENGQYEYYKHIVVFYTIDIQDEKEDARSPDVETIGFIVIILLFIVSFLTLIILIKREGSKKKD